MKYPKRSQYKYAESRYRVRNWYEYEAGLQKRGDLTVWLSDASLDAWCAPASGKPGGQRIYQERQRPRIQRRSARLRHRLRTEVLAGSESEDGDEEGL